MRKHRSFFNALNFLDTKTGHVLFSNANGRCRFDHDVLLPWNVCVLCVYVYPSSIPKPNKGGLHFAHNFTSHFARSLLWQYIYFFGFRNPRPNLSLAMIINQLLVKVIDNELKTHIVNFFSYVLFLWLDRFKTAGTPTCGGAWCEERLWKSTHLVVASFSTCRSSHHRVFGRTSRMVQTTPVISRFCWRGPPFGRTMQVIGGKTDVASEVAISWHPPCGSSSGATGLMGRGFSCCLMCRSHRRRRRRRVVSWRWAMQTRETARWVVRSLRVPV